MKNPHSLQDIDSISAKARSLLVDVFVNAGCGHPGGSFSCLDLLVCLYFGIMRIDTENPQWPDRDRFLLSKGHASAALYTVLQMKGFFDQNELLSFRSDNSRLCGHPDMHKVPGIEMNTGSLGHGLSIGVGLAAAAKMDGREHRTFVLMGDGETQEGSVWEAAMAAGHYGLSNLVGIVDKNRLQIDGQTEEVMTLEPYRSKWEAFGWEVEEIDGHHTDEIIETFKRIPFRKGRPSMVIANTIKGRGLSFMENNAEWHGKAISGEYAELAQKEVLDTHESRAL